MVFAYGVAPLLQWTISPVSFHVTPCGIPLFFSTPPHPPFSEHFPKTPLRCKHWFSPPPLVPHLEDPPLPVPKLYPVASVHPPIFYPPPASFPHSNSPLDTQRQHPRSPYTHCLTTNTLFMGSHQTSSKPLPPQHPWKPFWDPWPPPPCGSCFLTSKQMAPPFHTHLPPSPNTFFFFSIFPHHCSRPFHQPRGTPPLTVPFPMVSSTGKRVFL